MRVVVTGGLGAIGSYVVRCLIDSGAVPVILDAGTDRSRLLVPEGAYELHHADITDRESVAQALGELRGERLIHLAAKVGRNDEEPRAALELNCTGTLNVLDAWTAMGGGRAVVMSSRAVYGSFSGPHGHPDYAPTPEGYRTSPVGMYGATKLTTEYIARSFRQQAGGDVVVTRLAWTFGPGKGAQGIYGIYSGIIEQAVRGEAVRVPRGGDQPNDVLYNGEVARALVALALHSGTLEHSTFNIGSGHATTLEEFADAVRDVVPGAQISIGEGRGFEGFHSQGYGVLDVSRLASIGHYPSTDLRKQITDYVDVYSQLS